MKLFAHSKKDSFLVITAMVHTLLLFWLYQSFEASNHTTTILSSAGIIFLTCMNFQCVAHNFIHAPFFESRILNYIFSIWNTLLIGVPQTIYKYHHLNHHRHNNDYQDAEGKTEDYSSLFRYSKISREPESVFTYSILGPIRADLIELYRQGHAKNQGPQIVAETFLFLALLGFTTYLSPAFTLYCYLPVWFLGQAAAYAENYFEHYGATPGNRMTDSVSCYSNWYNFIWFNNGFHQEHHYRPQIHWSKVKEIKITEGLNRKIVKHAHWFNWPAFDYTWREHDSKSIFK